MRSNRRLFIIVPCYNEAEVLPTSVKVFLDELGKLITKDLVSQDSRILFVDNNSEDRTWEIICDLSSRNECILGLRQSKNRGHQSNVLAGLMEARQLADIAITIDCDGQDDVRAMEGMVMAYHEGFEIVYGVRNNRSTDSFFKRNTAQLYYRLLNRLGAEVVYNHADYRMTSKRVLDAFSNFEEVNLYLRGLFPLVGFKSTVVEYERFERVAGESHYKLRNLFSLAFDGITSLSIKPIRLITGLGGLSVIGSLAGILWVLFGVLRGSIRTAGWASNVCLVIFVGGVQLLSIGVLGEYIGKIYLEVKHRPRYIISDRVGYWE